MKLGTDQIIQGLWVGDRLSTIEQLSITSYLQNGFNFHLYTYNDIDNIPKGTKVIDANTVVPHNLIFTYSNRSYAAFSNLFRYALLYQKGGIWSDLDVVCIKPFQFKEEYVFSTEIIDMEYKYTDVGSFFIQAPKKTEPIKYAYEKCFSLRSNVMNGKILWGIGNSILKDTITKFNLESFKKPWKVFTTCNWEHIESFIYPDYKKADLIIPTKLSHIPEDTVAIHMWNEFWRRLNIDKDGTYPYYSLLEELKRKYLINI